MKHTALFTTVAALVLFGGFTPVTATAAPKKKKPAEATPKTKSAESNPQIPFDPEKIARDKVVAAVKAVFEARGYNPSLTRQQGVQFGAGGTVKPLESGPVKYVDMPLQPPVEGSKSKKWKFRAVINDRNVEMMVFIEIPPRDFLGMKLDSEPTSWKPAALKQVMEEIQTELAK